MKKHLFFLILIFTFLKTEAQEVENVRFFVFDNKVIIDYNLESGTDIESYLIELWVSPTCNNKFIKITSGLTQDIGFTEPKANKRIIWQPTESIKYDSACFKVKAICTPKAKIADKTEKNNINSTDNDIVWQNDKHGTFTDSRDGKKYKVVKIKNQIWLAENFNYTQGIPLITDNTKWGNLEDNNTDAAWCYYDNKPERGETYGALYTYAAALKVAPKGWHLPTKEEWDTLLSNNGGVGKPAYKALIKGGKSDLNILFGGWRYFDGSFDAKDEGTGFWSATEIGNAGAWSCDLYASNKNAGMNDDYKSFGFSVRLLRD